MYHKCYVLRIFSTLFDGFSQYLQKECLEIIHDKNLRSLNYVSCGVKTAAFVCFLFWSHLSLEDI